MRFIFPFSEINKDSRIVLYGASEEGYDFYQQLISTDYCKIVLWVDKQFEWYRTLNLPVEEPIKIKDISYDLIILTAEKKEIADSMVSDLISMGIDKEKIFWKEDCIIKGKIAAKFDPERIKKEAEDAKLRNPLELLDEDSLDIVIRVLYAKDLLEKKDCKKHRELYKKLMMGQNDGKEPTEDMIHAYFTEYSVKSGWEAFDKSFCNLVNSINENGFIREKYIPLDKKGKLINGRHRLGVAIALNVPIWTREYIFNGFGFKFNKDWLFNQGFDLEEINEIEKEYNILKGK